MDSSIRIEQIRVGLLSEGAAVGMPAVFIDLAGCRISCSIRGGESAKPIADDRAGQPAQIADLADRMIGYGLRYVSIGGGEPLLQAGGMALARELQVRGYIVHVESNATVDLAALPRGIIKIIEIKCPSEGTCYHINWRNLDLLGAYDIVRFPIMDRNDYVWACDVIRREKLLDGGNVYMIPVGAELTPNRLAEWILADRFPVRLSRPLDTDLHGAQGVL